MSPTGPLRSFGERIISTMQPETRYARSGDVNIAYQVVGEGTRDLIFVPGWLSNIEVFWEEPRWARFLGRFASFSRLILFDKRGTGLSDRGSVSQLPTLEQRMDDVRAVMDAVGSRSAALYGSSEGGVMCALFAATYPSRTSALILQGSYSRLREAPDYPWARPRAAQDAFLADIERNWGTPVGLDMRVPTLVRDERFRQWLARFLRLSASPTEAVALVRMNYEIDIRHVLPTIRVPTLILHSVGDRAIDIAHGRFLAQQIPGARLVEMPGIDHLPIGQDSDRALDEIEQFLTGSIHAAEPDRMLTTILFADIVGSTERVVALGDRKWRASLDSFYALARRELERHRGREIDTAGDGFFASFDGPARAVRCAQAIGDGTKLLGLDLRAGVHTGEVEVSGAKIAGVTVHVGARIMSKAAPGEVLVSNTVRDLVAGSGITFEDRGTHILKGVPGEWRLSRALPHGLRDLA